MSLNRIAWLPCFALIACSTPAEDKVVPVPPKAVLTNAPTAESQGSITVGGDRVETYSYRFDDESYSEPRSVADPILFAGFVAGAHSLEVVGIDADGLQQPETAATRHDWTIALDWVEAEVVHGASSMDIRVTLNGPGSVRYVVSTQPSDNAAFAESLVDEGTFEVATAYESTEFSLSEMTDDTTYYTYLAVPQLDVRTFESVFPIRHETGSFQTRVDPTVTIGYYAYKPEAYYKEPDTTFPLLVFFHGSGERGPGDTSNLRLVLRHGPPSLINAGEELPFIVVSPQTTPGVDWDLTVMDEVVELAKTQYRVDEHRIYITGVSLGGNAAWNYAVGLPNKVAAIIPISGWGTVNRACRMREVPVWAFHGDADDTVDVSGTRSMISALQRCDPPTTEEPIYTEYPGVGHNAWTRTYDNSATGGDIYEWLLMHRK